MNRRSILEKLQTLMLANAVEAGYLEDALAAIVAGDFATASRCVRAVSALDKSGVGAILGAVQNGGTN